MNCDFESVSDTPANALLSHEFYVYDLNLRLQLGWENTDLLAVLRQRRTFIIDNNIPWKQIAAAHLDKSFVIGRTQSEEAENLEGMYFSAMPQGGYRNVYALDIAERRRPQIVFHRIDSSFRRACFARPIPPLSRNSSHHQMARLSAAAAFRTQLEPLLVTPSEMLRQLLDRHLEHALGNIEDAGLAAVVVAALHLNSLTEARRRIKLLPTNLNLPGDSRLIAEALFLGFGIISDDVADVHTMGHLTGVVIVSCQTLSNSTPGI